MLDALNSVQITKLIVYDLAHKCSEKFIHDDTEYVETLARHFVSNVQEKTGLDVSKLFGRLLDTTTTE
jgi:hypothetical protein